MSHPGAAWAVEVQGVSFSYPGGITALRDVNFRAAPASMVAIVGANGSGKTTLLKLLMRLLRPQQGQVFLRGTDVAGLPPAQLYRQIGMVFQNPTDQLFALTVAQDVAFGPRNLGLSEKETAIRTEEALATVEVQDLGNRPIHSLSFGQQKRVCLAGVLAMRPPVLLLDEPLAGLDPVGESRLLDLLVRLKNQEGMTILFSTHAVDLVPEVADRVCVLHQGRVWREGPPVEVFTDPQLSAAGLRLPRIGQVFQQLILDHGVSLPRLPLTIAEARQEISRLLAKGNPADALEGETR